MITMKIFSAFLLTCLVQADLMSSPTDIRSFGLLTVTHARDDQNIIFNNYLSRYAQMECSQISQINVIWNNEKSPQELGALKNMQKWKRPIYFTKTVKNSMNFRYQLHKSSQALVYFNIDDDIIATCEQLQKGFQIWKDHQISGITPLMGYGPRSYDFKTNYSEFTYQYAEGNQFQTFSLLLIGISWIPRHYLNLYYMDTWELKAIRKIVKDRNNCDDIALNMIVNHFYPQFSNILISNQMKMDTHPQQGQSNLRNHIPFRNECLNEFVKILGYNPLRYQLKNITNAPTLSPEIALLTELKKAKLDELINLNKEKRQKEDQQNIQITPYLYKTREKNEEEIKQMKKFLTIRVIIYIFIIGVLLYAGWKYHS